MHQYLSSLLVQTVIFIMHFELGVVVLGLCSGGRGEYRSGDASKQQKTVFHSFSQYQSTVGLYQNEIPWDLNTFPFYQGNYYRIVQSERQLPNSVSRHINKDGLILTPSRCQEDRGEGSSIILTEVSTAENQVYSWRF